MKIIKVRGVRRRTVLSTALLALAVLVGGSALLTRGAADAAFDPLQSALAKVRAEGSYHFTGEVVATATPSAAVANAGKTGKSQRVQLVGDTDVVASATQVTATTTDGNGVSAAPLSVRSVDGVTSQRSGEGAWSVVPAGSGTSTFDLGTYLGAARDVVLAGEESLGGQSTTKYSFALNAAALAAASGRAVEGLTGSGELWVTADGVPARLSTTLRVPDSGAGSALTRTTIEYSEFGTARVSGVAHSASGSSWWQFDLFGGQLASWLLLFAGVLLALSIAVAVGAGSGERSPWSFVQAVALVTVFALFAADLVPPRVQAAAPSVVPVAAAVPARPVTDPATTARSVRQAQKAALADPHVNRLAVVPMLVNPADRVTDTDADGLSDFVEERIGTDPLQADSDGDTVSDLVEVNGFTVPCAANTGAPVMWFGDPNNYDTNDDGVPDFLEWGTDTDGNCTPDLFDDDNDGDGVSDRTDASPSVVAGSTAPFTQADPLRLMLNGLTSTEALPTYVEFQLRPNDASELQTAMQQMDWPADSAGQVMDLNDATSAPDMNLIPMLEITVPAGHVLPAAAELSASGIQVGAADGSGNRPVYVPLTLVKDPVSGADVAFAGRMVYLSNSAWATAQQVRLSWMVQVKNDVPCDPTAAGAAAAHCTSVGIVNGVNVGYIYDTPQVAHSYYDDWQLTGLTVSEQHGTDLAVIYEDPAVDTDIADSAPSWSLESVLEERFLAASPGTDTFEITSDNIVSLLDHNQSASAAPYELPDIFRVSVQHSATLDEAIASAATRLPTLVDQQFTPRLGGAAFQPLITTAFTSKTRSLALEGPSQIDGGRQIDLNLAASTGTPIVTTGGLKWNQYCATGSTPKWASCTLQQVSDDIERQSANDVTYDPDDPTQDFVGSDPLLTEGELQFARLLAAEMMQGRTVATQITTPANTVQVLNRTTEFTGLFFSGGAKLARLGIARIAAKRNLQRIALAATLTGEELLKAIIRTPGSPNGVLQIATASPTARVMTKLRNASGKVKALVAMGVVLAAAGAVTFLALSPDATRAMDVALVAVSLVGVIEAAVQFTTTAKQVMNSGNSLLGVLGGSTTELQGASRKWGLIGALVAGGITTLFFIYKMDQGDVTAFSAEFDTALAGLFADLAYIALLTVLALTIVGAVVVAIVSLVDAIITAVCDAQGKGTADCTTISSSITAAMVDFIFGTSPMVNVDASDLISVQSPTFRLHHPALGYARGNELAVSLPVDTTVTHARPDSWMMDFYTFMYSRSNIQSANFNYGLGTAPSAATSPGSWDSVTVSDTYKLKDLYRATKHEVVTGTVDYPVTFDTAGLNQAWDYSLKSAYTLPSYECWLAPNPFLVPTPAYPVCFNRTIDDTTSSDLPSLVLDIFPATLAEFLATTSRPGGLALAWDARFEPLSDADHDGSLPFSAGGLDPNDSLADTDGDGLSDATELDLRAGGYAVSPTSADADGDGLTDLDERRANTNPAIADTDNDGLSDGAEVRHVATDPQGVSRLAGGWDINVDGRTVRVYSDPRMQDSDLDGISDRAELQLSQLADLTKRVDDQQRPYNPVVANTPPVGVTMSSPDSVGFVAPGDTVNITSDVTTSVPLAPSVLDVTLPPAAGASPAPAALDFDASTFVDSQTRQHVTSFTVPAGQSTIEVDGGVRAWLASVAPTAPALTPIASGSVDPGAAGAAIDVVPGAGDRTDQFAVGELAGSQDAFNLDPLSGRGTRLNDLTGTFGRSDRPSIACNDAGVCMNLWAEYDNCSTITVRSIANTGNVDGTFGLFLNTGTDSLSSYLSRNLDQLQLIASAAVQPNDTALLGTLDVPYPTVTYCGAAMINARRITDLANPTVGTHLNTCLTDPCVQVNGGPFDEKGVIGVAINQNTRCIGTCSTRPGPQRFKSGPIDPLCVFPFVTTCVDFDFDVNGGGNRTALKAQLTDRTGALVGGAQSIGALPDSTYDSSVASDGNGFGVAWRSDAGNFFQRFGSDGAALEAAQRIVIGSQFKVVWTGDRYVVISRWKVHVGPGEGDFNDQYNALDMSTGRTVLLLDISSSDNRFDFAYDPATDNALLLVGANALSWTDFGSALTCVGACAAPTTATWFGGVAPAQMSVTRNPIAGEWLVTTNDAGATPMVHSFHDDLTLNGSAQTLARIGLSSTSSAELACPAQSAFPVADLRFEEMPGSATFADSSRWGRSVTPAAGASPDAGAPGAPLAANSHTSARFTSPADQLVVPAGAAPASSGGASLAFWYRADRNVAGTPFTIDTGSSGYRLQIDHQGSIGWRLGATEMAVNAPSLADGAWHFVAVARDANTPTVVYTQPYPTMSVYVDGALAGQAPQYDASFTPTAAVTVTGGSSTVSVDQLQVFNVALGADAVAAVRSNAEPFCMVAATNGSAVPWWKLAFRGSDGRGAGLTASASLRFRVDSDVPTSSVVVPDTALNSSVSTFVLSGSAVDPVDGSGVASVEVSLDGGAWVTATGTESWSLPIELGSGDVQVRTRATDRAGNVEVPSVTTTLLVDRVNPTVSLNALARAIAPTRDAVSGELLVGLSGTVADAGSGVAGVEVNVSASGSPVSPTAWQSATVTGGVWSLDYRMPTSVFEVSGSYTVRVRATDVAGNHTVDAAASAAAILDNKGPAVVLSFADRAKKVLAGSVGLTGPVTDTAGAGVASVDVAFTPIDEATSATPAPSVWRAATLLQPSGLSTSTRWSIDVPDAMEGYFQIDLRATDSLGNETVSRRVWSGIIDTRAPRLSLTATATGRTLQAGTRVEVGYACAAEDLFLDLAKFDCPGVSAKPATRTELAASSLKTALQTTFPGMAVIAKLSVSYNSWEASTSKNFTLKGCDIFGNCSSRVSAVRALVRAAQRAAADRARVSARAVSPFVAEPAPTAMIASPADGDHVAVGATADVVVSVQATASIKQIDVLLDGVVATTRSLGFGDEFVHDEVVAVPIAVGGSHTLEVITTDWNDVTGTSGEVGFFADLTAPAVTLGTTNIDLGDTWAVGTDFYRFSGTVADDGTVAAVQVRVNGGNWADAAFAGGNWHIALQIPGADGTNLSVSVRAFDLAGRGTTITGAAAVNLLPAQPTAYVRPGTRIVTGPAATVASATATFTFAGTPGDNGVSTYRCQLDTNTPVLCDTPYVLEGLAAGRHTLRVAAIDDAGYVDLTPATRSWTVTATGPRPTLVSAPTGSVTARTAKFEFTAPTGAVLECSVDGATPAPCTSPFTTSVLVDGVHTFTVQATLVGVSGTAVAATWTIVNLAPVAADQTVAVDADSIDGQAVTLAATDVSSLVYRVADAPSHGYLVGTAPNVIYVPFNGYRGTDRFTFVADDGQHISNTGTVRVAVRVPDTVNPVIVNPGDQTVTTLSTADGSVVFTRPTATDDSGTVTVVCDPESGSVLPAGTTTITCTATDPTGNTNAVTFTVTHVIDEDHNLPATGNGHLPIQEALLLLAIGLALVVAARRRHRTL